MLTPARYWAPAFFEKRCSLAERAERATLKGQSERQEASLRVEQRHWEKDLMGLSRVRPSKPHVARQWDCTYRVGLHCNGQSRSGLIVRRTENCQASLFGEFANRSRIKIWSGQGSSVLLLPESNENPAKFQREFSEAHKLPCNLFVRSNQRGLRMQERRSDTLNSSKEPKKKGKKNRILTFLPAELLL